MSDNSTRNKSLFPHQLATPNRARGEWRSWTSRQRSPGGIPGQAHRSVRLPWTKGTPKSTRTIRLSLEAMVHPGNSTGPPRLGSRTCIELPRELWSDTTLTGTELRRPRGGPKGQAEFGSASGLRVELWPGGSPTIPLYGIGWAPVLGWCSVPSTGVNLILGAWGSGLECLWTA